MIARVNVDCYVYSPLFFRDKNQSRPFPFTRGLTASSYLSTLLADRSGLMLSFASRDHTDKTDVTVFGFRFPIKAV